MYDFVDDLGDNTLNTPPAGSQPNESQKDDKFGSESLVKPVSSDAQKGGKRLRRDGVTDVETEAETSEVDNEDAGSEQSGDNNPSDAHNDTNDLDFQASDQSGDEEEVANPSFPGKKWSRRKQLPLQGSSKKQKHIDEVPAIAKKPDNANDESSKELARKKRACVTCTKQKVWMSTGGKAPATEPFHKRQYRKDKNLSKVDFRKKPKSGVKKTTKSSDAP